MRDLHCMLPIKNEKQQKKTTTRISRQVINFVYIHAAKPFFAFNVTLSERQTVAEKTERVREVYSTPHSRNTKMSEMQFEIVFIHCYVEYVRED